MKPCRTAISAALLLASLAGCQTGGVGASLPRTARTAAKASVAPATLAPASVKTSAVASQPLRGTVSVDAHYLVSAGIADVSGRSQATTVDALAALRRAAGLVGNDAASLVGNDAASLVGNDAASLVARDGVTLLGQDGAAVVGAAAVQGRLIANGGGNLIANGGGNLRAGVAAFAGTRSEVAYGLRNVSRVAPGTVTPAAGMVVQLIDLWTGLPIVMVDSKGRVGDAVLTDAAGQYQVYLPESFDHNVMVQVHAPGQLADARARYARLTVPGATRPDIHDNVSAVAGYFRGALAARLLYLFSRDPAGMSTLPPGEMLIAQALKPSIEAIRQAKVFEWSKLEQHLLARRMADRLLARVKNWERLPLVAIDPSGTDEEFTARVVFAMLAGDGLPTDPRPAADVMAKAMDDLMDLAKAKMNTEGYRFVDNPMFKLVNAYAAEWQSGHFGSIPIEQRPPWLRAGGFDVKAPADLCDFIARALTMSDRDRELRLFMTANRSIRNPATVIVALKGLGVAEQDAQTWWNMRSARYFAVQAEILDTFGALGLEGEDLVNAMPDYHFRRLLRSLGESNERITMQSQELRLAATSIMAALMLKLVGKGNDVDPASLQKEYIDDINYYATPEGRKVLLELSSLK